MTTASDTPARHREIEAALLDDQQLRRARRWRSPPRTAGFPPGRRTTRWTARRRAHAQDQHDRRNRDRDEPLRQRKRKYLPALEPLAKAVDRLVHSRVLPLRGARLGPPSSHPVKSIYAISSVTLTAACGFLPSSSAFSASSSAKLCVWIGDRSMPVRSRKRIAEGQTPGEPMQPRTVRFLIWILPSSTGNFWPMLMPTIETRPSGRA